MSGPSSRAAAGLLIAASLGAQASLAQDTASVRARSDSIQVRFVESDLRAVIRALSVYLEKPLLVSDITATKVSFETPSPVPRAVRRTDATPPRESRPTARAGR